MPVYEYHCGKGHEFEVLQRMSDPPVTDCDVCGEGVQRVLHAPAIHFKGSGFYNTDYGKRKGATSADGGDSRSDAAGSDSDGAKPDGAAKSASGDSSGAPKGKASEKAASS